MLKYWWNIKVFILRLLHFPHILRTESRKELEYNLLFYLAKEIQPKQILSIGVGPYTTYYPRLFPKAQFKTIDLDPSAAQWASPGNHTIADATKINDLWQRGTFDLVLFNGVYGWGMNSQKQLTETLDCISILLKPNGFLLFGWNKTPATDPIDIENNLREIFSDFSIASLNQKKFIQLKIWKMHRYRFFRKKPSSE